jgi:hypothetical protein
MQSNRPGLKPGEIDGDLLVNELLDVAQMILGDGRYGASQARRLDVGHMNCAMNRPFVREVELDLNVFSGGNRKIRLEGHSSFGEFRDFAPGDIRTPADLTHPMNF